MVLSRRAKARSSKLPSGWAEREGAEDERLDLQARAWSEPTGDLLAAIGLRAGASVIDLGCGPRGILDLASRLVGPTGRVVGVDAVPRRVLTAKLNAIAEGWPAVEVVLGDATATGFPDATFDLVHARFLAQQCDPARLVAEMIRLARPGGVIALQELGRSPWEVEPEPAGWPELAAVVHGMFVSQPGADGESMAARLAATNLERVRARDVRLRIPGGHEYAGTLQFAFASARASLLRSGRRTGAELADSARTLSRVVADPNRRHWSFSVVQTFGRKGPTVAGGSAGEGAPGTGGPRESGRRGTRV